MSPTPSSVPPVVELAWTLVLDDSDSTPDIDGGSLRAAALCGFTASWPRLGFDESEPLCCALLELLRAPGCGFDDDLRVAIVDLLAAADHADGEVHTDRRPLSMRSYDRLRRAHEAIGSALAAVHDRELGSVQGG